MARRIHPEQGHEHQRMAASKGHPEQMSQKGECVEGTMWYVYILECKDGSFYTGVTDNIKRRLTEHRKKTSHYTGYNPPRNLIYREPHRSKASAEKREAQIKRWSHAKKQALISGNFEDLRRLSKSSD